MPLVALLVVSVLGGLLAGREAHAACNLIPSASKTFRGALGATNRPFAAPGDFVEVAVDTARCDTGSSGFAADGADHVVTLVFKPTGGQARVVALSAASCTSGTMKSARLACEGTLGVGAGNVACVQVPPSDLAVVERNGSRRLSFRFPDTDAFFVPDGDDRTLSGPATIAVTPAGAPLPCGLATSDCASQSGAISCVDDLYAADGTCQQVVNGTFGHFTALPQANDYASVCFADSPVPCNPTATELRIATDAAGNLLVPFNWEGILVNDSGIPVPRLMRATLRSPLGFSVPDSVFLGSFTPEGARLPPLFEPTADPSVASPDVITLFGSADAPYTILRIARHAGTCSNAAKTCVHDTDCPAGGTCPSTCVGGSTPGTSCASDAQCSGGRCGALFADFRPFVAGGGPLAVPRTPIGPGVCQLDPHASCNAPADCAGVGNTCVAYAFEARTPVPLESLTAGTSDQFAFTVEERVDLADHNGDGDATDSVITLRDRTTGRSQNLGAPAGCGIAGTPEGRAVVRINQPPFNFPAVAIEDDVLAFLESEPGENRCDEDGNGDASGSIARVFRLGTGEVPMSPVRGVDANLLVNGQSLAVSNGRVFFRSSEPVMGKRTTERVSLTPGGLGPNGDSSGNALSYDGRYVAFYSVASDLPNPNISPNCSSLYLRDRVAGTTEQLDPGAGGTPPRCIYFGGGSKSAEMSPDGRFVAFVSDDWNLEDPVFNAATSGTYAVHLRDRCVANGVAVGGGCVAGNTMVSVGPGGAYCALPPPPLTGLGTLAGPAVSDDGRFVAFISNCTNFDPADTNDEDDAFVRDTCLSNGAPVPGCVATTERVSGLAGAPDSGWTVDSGRIDLSADGRYVAFSGELSLTERVFLRDRLLGTTEIVNVDSQGTSSNTRFAENPQISADGRFVLFSTNAAFVSGDTNTFDDLYVRDRLLGTMDRVNIGTDGAQGDSVTFWGRMSRDGRHVAFWSSSSTLLGPGGDTNAATDIFVRDRLVNVTRRVSVAYDGAQSPIGSSNFFSDGFAISGDGQTVAFDNADANLLPPGVDTNGRKDLFVRGVDAADPNGVDTLLFDNDRLTDSVLEVMDTGTNTLRTLCPATQAAVAGGMAAFLRPESSVGTVACPAGSLNGDADVADTVVDLWPGSGNPVSLGLAATAVAMSDTTIAALVSESGQGNTILNGDGDRSDAVVEVHPATVGGVWTNTGQAGEALEVCGPRAVFLTPEWQQGAISLNPPDSDTTDRVLQIWDTSVVSGNLINTQQQAEDFVCGPSLIALRTNEAAQGADLNSDGDTTDDVLQVYDTTTSTLYDTHQAVSPCRLPQCDPRLPYRVFARSVKFLTVECDQHGSVVSGFCGSGGTDLNDDGDADDIVIQLFDVATDTTRTIGTVTGGNPLAGGDPTTGTGTAYVSAGACVETVGGKLQGVCVTDADCPPGSTCEPLAIVPASPDTDADGVPDHLDVCPRDADPGQVDGDGDGTGDACDAATCGNDVVEGTEACDGAAGGACPGSCQSDCTCLCTNVVADAKAKVEVTTKRGVGKLSAKMAIPLGSYTGDAVVVRLDDGDSQPIALRSLVTLPPFGKSGKTWRFKAKSEGLQMVQLKSLAPKQPGMFQIIVNAKRWFTAGAANDPAASTRLTITVGGQCFTHVVTKKTD